MDPDSELLTDKEEPEKRISKPNPRYNKESSSTPEPKKKTGATSAKIYVAKTSQAGPSKTSPPATSFSSESSNDDVTAVDHIMEALQETSPSGKF